MSAGFLLKVMNVFWNWMVGWLHDFMNILKATDLCAFRG